MVSTRFGKPVTRTSAASAIQPSARRSASQPVHRAVAGGGVPVPEAAPAQRGQDHDCQQYPHALTPTFSGGIAQARAREQGKWPARPFWVFGYGSLIWAPGLRLRRPPAGDAARLSARLLHALDHVPRHARGARPGAGARPRPGRQLRRRRLPGRPRRGGGDARLPARARARLLRLRRGLAGGARSTAARPSRRWPTSRTRRTRSTAAG